MAVKNGKIISIASVKGGVGKTTMAVNLAGIYYMMKKRVLIIDFDLYGGGVAALLNVKNQKDIFQLIELSADIAALVPYNTLKLITDTLNENSISTYVYLLNCYYSNNCQPFQFTLDQVKSYIGISTSTRSNNDIITNILYVLEKIGLIKYSLTTMKQEADTFQNVKTIYQLDWLTNTLN